MNEDEIRLILGEHVDFEAWQGEFHIEGKVTGLDAAVKAIAALPVDQVQAMAATIFQNHMGDYKVQGNGVSCLVWESDGWHCSDVDCPLDCDHVRAVELAREIQHLGPVTPGESEE